MRWAISSVSARCWFAPPSRARRHCDCLSSAMDKAKLNHGIAHVERAAAGPTIASAFPRAWHCDRFGDGGIIAISRADVDAVSDMQHRDT